MVNDAPTNEPVGQGWTPEWVRWLKLVQLGLSAWRRSARVDQTIDFGSVSANSELAASTISMRGARPLDVVQIAPQSNTAGITFKGVVTANDEVTIYAINYTTGAINPASMTYRIVVFQQ